MNIYLSAIQANNIVNQLKEIIQGKVFVTDELGLILACSEHEEKDTYSNFAKESVEQANQMRLYNERYVNQNQTATPIFYKNVCVGSIVMEGDLDHIKRLTSIAKAVGESVINKANLFDSHAVSEIAQAEFLSEWLNTCHEYSLPFIRRGNRLGIDVNESYYCVILTDIWNTVSAQKMVESAISIPNYSLNESNNTIILILHPEHDSGVLNEIRTILCDIKISIGKIDENLNRSYLFAKNTLFAGQRLFPERRIFHYKDFEFIYAISDIKNLAPSQMIQEFFEQPQNSDLLQTFEAYISEDGNHTNVSNKLYIHRNTLTYRLDKILEITGYDLRKFNDLFYIYSAYILFKLKK